VDHLSKQILAQKSVSLSGFLSINIKDKINLQSLHRKHKIAYCHTEYIMKILNGMPTEKFKFIIDLETKLIDKKDHPILRVSNLIETRELIINMLRNEQKSFEHDRLNQICNLINDLKKISINVILAIVEWRD